MNESPNTERILDLPGTQPTGELFVRGRGRKRWIRFGSVVGRVVLDPDCEYKLRFTTTLFAPAELARHLTGVSCEVLTEIEAPLAVSSRDWWDQASRGDMWLQRAIERQETELTALLRTSARVILTPDLIDFESQWE